MIRPEDMSVLVVNPASMAMRGMHSYYVRFSVLALSSIFFLA